MHAGPRRGAVRRSFRIRLVEVRVRYDGDADATYIYLVPIGAGESVTTVPGEGAAASVNLDFNRDGQLHGIEVLSASTSLPPDVIKRAERIGWQRSGDIPEHWPKRVGLSRCGK